VCEHSAFSENVIIAHCEVHNRVAKAIDLQLLAGINKHGSQSWQRGLEYEKVQEHSFFVGRSELPAQNEK